jgi:hypothetical protein
VTEITLSNIPNSADVSPFLYPETRNISSFRNVVFVPNTGQWTESRPCHSSGGIYGGQSGAMAGFLRVFRLPLPIFIPLIAPQSPSSVIWRWYNRPIVTTVPRGLSLTPLIIIIIIIMIIIIKWTEFGNSEFPNVIQYCSFRIEQFRLCPRIREFTYSEPVIVVCLAVYNNLTVWKSLFVTLYFWLSPTLKQRIAIRLTADEVCKPHVAIVSLNYAVPNWWTDSLMLWTENTSNHTRQNRWHQ